MTKNSAGLIACLLTAVVFVAPRRALAADDFGRIVHHIEAQYHVHRQHRLAMGFAGFVVKFYHFAGVKSLKGAIFENQPFLNAGADRKFDEVVRAAMDSGWQPMVQSWDRHSGERTYIYAQDLGMDMKVLIVTLEPTEAVVLQVKVNPKKLNEFVREASAGSSHHGDRGREAEHIEEQRVETATFTPQNWDGVCLLAQEEEQSLEPQP